MHDRRYFLPALRLAIARTLLGLLLAGWLAIAIVAGGVPLWLWPIQVAIIGWAAYVGFFADVRPAETQFGFQTRSQQSMLWQKVAWADIAEFSELAQNPLTGLRLACLVERSGRRIPIMAISAGRTVRWDGGQTDDIVGELNLRLEGWRRELSPVAER